MKPTTLEELSEAFKNWCASQNLPHASASDLIGREDLTPRQYAYLKAFIDCWEAAERLE